MTLTRTPSGSDTHYRLFVVLGLLSFILAGLGYLFPGFMLRKGTFLFGLFILSFALVGWRSGYAWLIRRPALRERVCVLGYRISGQPLSGKSAHAPGTRHGRGGMAGKTRQRFHDQENSEDAS